VPLDACGVLSGSSRDRVRGCGESAACKGGVTPSLPSGLCARTQADSPAGMMRHRSCYRDCAADPAAGCRWRAVGGRSGTCCSSARRQGGLRLGLMHLARPTCASISGRAAPRAYALARLPCASRDEPFTAAGVRLTAKQVDASLPPAPVHGPLCLQHTGAHSGCWEPARASAGRRTLAAAGNWQCPAGAVWFPASLQLQERV